MIVEVGPKRTQYHIHHVLLMQHSEIFEKALKGPWQEAEKGIVKLEDVECVLCA